MLLALAAPIEVVAQGPPPVSVGQRVRVSTESGTTHVGVISIAASGVIGILDEAGIQSSFPLSTVTRLEVSRGQSGNAATGALIGFAAGSLGVLALCDCDDYTGGFAVILGGVGGLVGMIIGGNSKTDQWRRVPLYRRRVSLAPTRDGRLALGFSLAF